MKSRVTILYSITLITFLAALMISSAVVAESSSPTVESRDNEMDREVIKIGGPWDKRQPYSSGIITSGRTLYTSGLTSTDGDGNVIGDGDMGAQVKQVFARLEAVLDEVGADFSQVVKYNIFVTDMDAYFEAAAHRDFYVDTPASCLIEVKGLARPELLVELEAIVAL